MGTLKQTQDKLFEHVHVFTGYEGCWPYFTISKDGAIDGIGREHLSVYATCDICHQQIQIGMTHKNREEKP